MNKILISKINEVFIELECEDSIKRELSDYFSFEVPNARFLPAYQNRYWDGKIRLFDSRTNQIYFGLKTRIEDFAKNRGYEVEYDYTGADLEDPVAECDIADYIDNLQLQSDGQDIQARSHQFNTVLECTRRKRKLILSPTASGKSLAIYALARWYIDKGLKGILIVPTIHLVDQMYTDFQDYSTKNGWDVPYHVHRLYSGQAKILTTQKLLITTWQSAVKMPNEFFEQFNFVIGDEAQGFAAKSLISIMTKLVNAPYKFGFSGSLSGAVVHQSVIEGLFGRTLQVATTEELIEKGYLAVPNIRCMIMKYNQDTCKSLKNLTYQEEIEWIISNEKRNQFIAKLAASFKGNTLILFHRIEKHGDLLYPLLEKYAPGRVYYIHGKTDVDERNEIRELMERNNGIICLASRGVFSVGVNIKNLHNGIVAHPSKSRILTLQSLGRGLRKGNRKEEVNWYDFADDLRYKSHMNATLGHFLERAKMYNEERLKYKIFKIELEGIKQ